MLAMMMGRRGGRRLSAGVEIGVNWVRACHELERAGGQRVRGTRKDAGWPEDGAQVQSGLEGEGGGGRRGGEAKKGKGNGQTQRQVGVGCLLGVGPSHPPARPSKPQALSQR